ncbi:MAG: glycoside hydrolase family 2 TIM barrel-domain containing protein [Chitinophagaceae bacterium]
MKVIIQSRRTFRLTMMAISCSLLQQVQAQQTTIQYLSGKDKDHTINWDFMCSAGRNSGKWSTIPVPSNWEMQGFGSYMYSRDNDNPEQGFYKHQFKLSPQVKGKKIIIVFEASMTDTEVKINGVSAGPVHQGGFYEFKYDISSLVKFGTDNTLEVKVSRHSANESINHAERQSDFWLFGGIFRPVYLQILPPNFIDRVALDAKANGDFNMQVFANVNSGQTIEAQVADLAGKPVDKAFQLMPGDSMLHHHFGGIKLWNPEQPNLYQVIVSIKQGAKTIHEYKQRFGFRTTELRLHDGFYVNDKKVIFKGVCRHSEWPESGRTLSRAIHLIDIAAIKGMNMNAVRMSHYPPDKEFLDLCDSLGLFVLDELTGWQKAYDTVTAVRLVKELVVRDVNHPSIVIWDNGNEGGWNRSVDRDYDLYDPQKRLVIHPWEKIYGTNTKHYPDFKLLNQLLAEKEVFFPTEFMHGLFDGGHGASLSDFWSTMMKSPISAGGFLWSLHDEGVVRADRHDSIDVQGNLAPDGIVGPHREKEGSYYAIKEIWSPVQIETKKLPINFDGTIPVSNHYIYTNLNKCRFEWKLVQFPGAKDKTTNARVISKGVAATVSMEPNESGSIKINMGNAFSKADAFYLSAYDWNNNEIFAWSWAIQPPKKIGATSNAVVVNTAITTKDAGGIFDINCDGITYHFDKSTGFLTSVVNAATTISLSNGPSFAGVSLVLESFKHSQQGNQFIVEPVYQDSNHFTVKWIFEKGKLPRLSYQYSMEKAHDFAGITFNYPEEKITGMKWLGRGPYHVWKNRLEGLKLGVWQKDYNDAITGERWIYPEFKGWHSEVYWATVQNKESNFTIYTTEENSYWQMLEPAKPAGAKNTNTSPAFPGNTIGFFNAISPIGTKFNKPETMGPQAQKNPPSVTRVSGTLLFDFGVK